MDVGNVLENTMKDITYELSSNGTSLLAFVRLFEHNENNILISFLLQLFFERFMYFGVVLHNSIGPVVFPFFRAEAFLPIFLLYGHFKILMRTKGWM